MQYFIISALLLIVLVLLAFITKFNLKKIKNFRHDSVLDEMVKRFPSNLQICQYILNMLGNNHSKIKEDKESDTSLYTIYNDTISIGKVDDTYLRVQTIAHECLHSTQDKLLLWFNFVFSNIAIISYFIIFLLTIFGIIKNGLFWILILFIITFIQFFVRGYLEMDAMLRAKDLARQYMRENKLSSKCNIDIIINKCDDFNKIGVKSYCFMLILKPLIKLIVYSFLCGIIFYIF